MSIKYWLSVSRPNPDLELSISDEYLVLVESPDV
jgi:hypothetical protein